MIGEQVCRDNISEGLIGKAGLGDNVIGQDRRIIDARHVEGHRCRRDTTISIGDSVGEGVLKCFTLRHFIQCRRRRRIVADRAIAIERDRRTLGACA